MFKVHATYIVGLYIACDVIANLTAGKITLCGPFTVPAAIYIFAITFTLIDLINLALGKQAARRVVLAAFAANIVLALYSILVVHLPSPPWFTLGQSFNDVLGVTPRIVAASLAASLLSGLLDVELFARLRERLNPGWRVVCSNALSTLTDSVMFIMLAFAGAAGFGAAQLGLLILGQYVVKMAVTVVSVPLIYLVKTVVSVDTALSEDAGRDACAT